MVGSWYCTLKRMYMTSLAWPSPGIEPRMPIVSGWSLGLHTSTVAHSSRECSSVLARRGRERGGEQQRRDRAASGLIL